MECIFANDRMATLHVLLKEIPQDKDSVSEVPPVVAIVVWIAITIVFYWRDSKNRLGHGTDA
jgi:hypothetical protein